MTRAEFDESVRTFDDLFAFCEGYDQYDGYIEDLVLSIDYSARIDDDIIEAIRNWNWTDVRDFLQELPEDYDCYRCNGLLDYSGLNNNDLEGIIDELRNELESDGFFDEEDDDWADEPEENGETDQNDSDTVIVEVRSDDWDGCVPMPTQVSNVQNADMTALRSLIFT